MRQPLESLPAFIWRTQGAGRKGVAVTECLGDDCRFLLGIGNYTRPLQSVQFAIRRSIDGGVTWSSTPTESGKGALLRAFAGDELLLEQPWVEGMPTTPRGAYFLFPSGREVLPPPGLAARSLTTPSIAGVSARPSANPAGIPDMLWHYTVRGAVVQEDRFAWDSRLRAEAEGRPIEGREPFPSDLLFPRSAWSSFGDVMLVWSEGARHEGRWGVTSWMPGDPLVRYAYEGLADAGAWLLDELTFPPIARFVVSTSTANSAVPEPRTSARWPVRLVLLDAATGDVQPYIAPELEDAKIGWVLLAYQGPFARAVRAGSCTEVRAAPSTAAPVLECAANGVLFQRTAPPTVDGAWLGVTSPAGVSGWTETRYLEW